MDDSDYAPGYIPPPGLPRARYIETTENGIHFSWPETDYVESFTCSTAELEKQGISDLTKNDIVTIDHRLMAVRNRVDKWDAESGMTTTLSLSPL